jgi:hypothetical protein
MTTGSSTGSPGVTETVQDMASQAKQQTGELKSKAKEQATSRVSEQKDRAAQTLGSVATAVTQVSNQLRSDNPSIAQAVDTFGQKLQTWSDNLSTQDVSDLMQRAERFARQNPTAFLAGAFAIGFLGARFLKSSTPESERSGFGRFEPGMYGYRGYGAYDAYASGYGTRPDYVTGYGTSYGSPETQRAGYAGSYDTTGYGTTPTTSTTPTTGYGTANVGGGITSGATDTTGTTRGAETSRTSFSPYTDTTETGTPTTER